MAEEMTVSPTLKSESRGSTPTPYEISRANGDPYQNQKTPVFLHGIVDGRDNGTRSGQVRLNGLLGSTGADQILGVVMNLVRGDDDIGSVRIIVS